MLQLEIDGDGPLNLSPTSSCYLPVSGRLLAVWLWASHLTSLGLIHHLSHEEIPPLSKRLLKMYQMKVYNKMF